MKGVILSTSFFIGFIGFLIFVTWSNNFNYQRLKLDRALKTGINEAALYSLDIEKVNKKKAMEIVEKSIKKNKSKKSTYQISLMGYHENPLALRVKLFYKDTSSFLPISFTLEKTIIEEADYID